MIATHPRRRADDRAPITTRITWAFWRAVTRLEREAPAIVGVCVVAVFWAALIACALTPHEVVTK